MISPYCLYRFPTIEKQYRADYKATSYERPTYLLPKRYLFPIEEILI